MFRCKECGCEFKIKPDYCDCGNNTFDEIPTAKISSMPDFRQIISVMIFVLCIILAIIPWTIKEKTKSNKPAEKQEQPAVKEIPDIDELWKSKPAKNSEPKPQTKQAPTPAPVLTVTKTPEPQATPPKPTPKPSAKPVKKTEKPKPAQQPKKQTPPAQPKTTSVNKPPKVVQKVAEQVANPKPKPKQSVSKPKPVDMTPLINYKNDLRIALLSKLNVPNIQGSGDCAVSFSIDSSGKLLNRAFVYKSSNKSVNDEVYYMLMRLPYFKKPPEIYKGETIKMKFYFNNGYYEISFI